MKWYLALVIIFPRFIWGKGNSTANSEVLSIVEQCTEMSSPAPVRHPYSIKLYLHYHYEITVEYGLGKSPLPLTNQLKLSYCMFMSQRVKLILCMESLIMQYYREIKVLPFLTWETWSMYQLKLTAQGLAQGPSNSSGVLLVFHKITGQPFAVTYSIDAVVKPALFQN